MGRIRFISMAVELSPSGFEVRLSIFSSAGVIRREAYDRLSWREARELTELLVDEFRPGTELLNGGVQPALFD